MCIFQVDWPLAAPLLLWNHASPGPVPVEQPGWRRRRAGLSAVDVVGEHVWAAADERVGLRARVRDRVDLNFHDRWSPALRRRLFPPAAALNDVVLLPSPLDIAESVAVPAPVAFVGHWASATSSAGSHRRSGFRMPTTRCRAAARSTSAAPACLVAVDVTFQLRRLRATHPSRRPDASSSSVTHPWD